MEGDLVIRDRTVSSMVSRHQLSVLTEAVPSCFFNTLLIFVFVWLPHSVNIEVFSFGLHGSVEENALSMSIYP